MLFLPSFHHHDDFIEGNENFNLGAEDLEKLNNFLKNFKNFKILNSKNSYFKKNYHSYYLRWIDIFEILSLEI